MLRWLFAIFPGWSVWLRLLARFVSMIGRKVRWFLAIVMDTLRLRSQQKQQLLHEVKHSKAATHSTAQTYGLKTPMVGDCEARFLTSDVRQNDGELLSAIYGLPRCA